MGETTLQSNQATLNIYLGHRIYDECILGQKDVIDAFTNSHEIQTLLNTINYQFKNPSLLTQAFCHTSFVHEYNKQNLLSFERLEFLGDSVLGHFIALRLFTLFNDQKEGNLSKIKNTLVNEASLFELARVLNISDLVLLGKGELSQGLTTSIISDVFEALIGAISIDSNISQAFLVLERIIKLHEEKSKNKFFDENKIASFDSKSIFQELTMKEFKCLPEYESHEEANLFTVSVRVNGVKLHELKSPSKKQAMKDLAKYCLENKLLDKLKN